MRETTKKLTKLVDNFIDNKIDYQILFSNFFQIQNEALDIDDEEAQFEWDIDDQIAYTTDNPDKQDRNDGMQNPEELREWLKEYKKKNIKFWS